MDCAYIYLFVMKPLKQHLHLLFNLAFKLIVCLLLLYIVNRFVFKNNGFQEAFNIYDFDRLKGNIVYLIFLVLLMPLNWYLESMKWKKTIGELGQSVGTLQSIKAILVGVTLGIITPARIGEYVGRSLLVSKNKNTLSLISTFICSLAQNVVTILMGICASISFFYLFNQELELKLILVANAIVLVVGMMVYFRIDKLLDLLGRVKFLKSRIKTPPNFKFGNQLLLSVLMLSFTRYTVYMLQFILALKFFALNTSVVNYLSAIGTIFFIQSSVPVPPILDLFARGEIAIFVFNVLKFNIAGILMASGLLWVINLVLPAFIGLVLLLKVNVLKSLGYESNKHV